MIEARTFASLYGREPEVTASAPGRVNLIGEHTDYSGGFVLPTAIPQRTRVELAVRDDQRVSAWSRENGDADPEAYQLGAEARGRGWLDYVQGVTYAAARAGCALRGFDLRIESDVPVGAGLSSSAALEVSILRALREAFGLPLDDLEIALCGQRAENDLVGAPVGVMDQLASSLADTAHALFVDTRALEVRAIPLPPGADLIVIASGVVHSHAGGEYRTRRAECERAAELLGVPQLRDLTIADVDRAMALPEPLGRRARHVVTENARVLAAVTALEKGDLEALGVLFAASHASMRDDFEVSIPEIDALVELAARDPDVVAARLTGGGFGGSIVALALRGTAATASARIAAAYHDATAQKPAVLVPPPYSGSAAAASVLLEEMTCSPS
jgi:galactokinase